MPETDDPSCQCARTRAPTSHALLFGTGGSCGSVITVFVYGAFTPSMSAPPPYNSASIHGFARHSTLETIIVVIAEAVLRELPPEARAPLGAVVFEEHRERGERLAGERPRLIAAGRAQSHVAVEAQPLTEAERIHLDVLRQRLGGDRRSGALIEAVWLPVWHHAT